MNTISCPLCIKQFKRLMRHLLETHNELYIKECEKAIELYKNGLTLREIGDSDLTYWSFGKALGDLIRKNTNIVIEEERKKEYLKH